VKPNVAQHNHNARRNTCAQAIERNKAASRQRKRKMSTELLGIVVNDSGMPILPVGNPAGKKAFFRMFFDTEIGQKLLPHMSAQVEARLAEVIGKRFGDATELTLDQFSGVVEQLLRVRDTSIFPIEEPAPVAEERPRDANGRFISEFEIWASDPNRSMKEIRDRASRDAEFREWFQTVSVGQTYQDGGLRIAGTPTRPATDYDREKLGEFARLWKLTPAAKLKPLDGIVTLDSEHRYSVGELNKFIHQAASVGLI
jgi:hypothetical protein